MKKQRKNNRIVKSNSIVMVNGDIVNATTAGTWSTAFNRSGKSVTVFIPNK